MKQYMKQTAVFFLAMVFMVVMGTATLLAQEAPDALAKYREGRSAESAGRTAESTALYNEAVQICRTEIDNSVSTIDTYVVLTWTLQRQRKYNEVLTWGQRALNIKNDGRIYETMGEAYFYLDNYNASLLNMRRYVNSLPQGERVSTAYFFIGEIYRMQNKLHYADIAYTTAVRLEPGMALWWYRLGIVREALGEANYATEAFERALRINPSYNDATTALSRVKKPV
jgi:tetratricopeptide (TPR) repeat protein